MTGSTYFIPELSAKQLELLKEVIPGLTDVAILLNPANPMNEPVVPAMKQTAQSLKVELHQFRISDPAELEGAFAAMAARRVGALVAIDDATLIANAALIAKLALRQRLPASGWPDFAVSGGLMAYGINYIDMFRRAAAFVDKILKRRQASRHSGRACDQVRDDRQPGDRQGAESGCAHLGSVARRRGNRVKTVVAALR